MSAIIHFGADGWRARLDDDFTEDNVVRVADAAARVWSASNTGAIVYVAYDARPEAEAYARVVAGVLSGRGLVPKLSESYAPVPALAWAVSQDARACGGVMVTGSHHAADYLGIKFRVSDGGIGSLDFYEELEDAVPSSPVAERGPYGSIDMVGPYLSHLLTLIDVEAITDAHLKVVCDPMHGAARGYLARALRMAGVEVAELHGGPGDPRDAIHPDPVEPWADECEGLVSSTGACMGLLNDGDADQVGLVDERGRFVEPQKVMALMLMHLCVNRGMNGRVVLDVAASRLTCRVAGALGQRVFLKPAGPVRIYMEVSKGDVLMGAGGSGALTIPSLAAGPDGLLSALLLCELVARTGMEPGSLIERAEFEFGRTSLARRDLRVGGAELEMLRTILPGLNPPEIAGRVPVSVNHVDGVRLDFEDGSWLLVRPSGTEGAVRVYAEASTVTERDELLEAGLMLASGPLANGSPH